MQHVWDMPVSQTAAWDAFVMLLAGAVHVNSAIQRNWDTLRSFAGEQIMQCDSGIPRSMADVSHAA